MPSVERFRYLEASGTPAPRQRQHGGVVAAGVVTEL
jgi:hypothetical protein